MRALQRSRIAPLLALVMLLSCASSAGNFCETYDPNVLYDGYDEHADQMFLRASPRLAPEWSLAGDRIVFTAWPSGVYRFHPQAKSSIWAVAPDGSDLRMVSAQRTDLDYESDHSADISPDGSRILYVTNRHKIEGQGGNPPHPRPKRNFEIETSKLDGSDRQKLTDHIQQDVWPGWSPDGGRIAFARTWPGGSKEERGIYVMNSDGSDIRQLFHFDHFTKDESTGVTRIRRQFFQAGPVWSPDGEVLAFVVKAQVGRGPGYDWREALYVVRADGTEYRVLFTTLNDIQHVLAHSFQWSPDGSSLAVLAYLVEDYRENSDGNAMSKAKGYGPPLRGLSVRGLR